MFLGCCATRSLRAGKRGEVVGLRCPPAGLTTFLDPGDVYAGVLKVLKQPEGDGL